MRVPAGRRAVSFRGCRASARPLRACRSDGGQPKARSASRRRSGPVFPNRGPAGDEWPGFANSASNAAHVAAAASPGYPDDPLREDIRIPISRFREGKRHIPEGKAWRWVESAGGETYAQYPAELRKTLAVGTQNLLVEAGFRTAPGHVRGTLMAKHDGRAGYRLMVNTSGRAEFQIASGGSHDAVATAQAVNDGRWHHVLAEVDRQSGRMTIYLDGKTSGRATASLQRDASLDNPADFLVGKSDDDTGYFEGAIDFMRVCQGTLADAQTTIEELYEWQTNGPFRHDFCGRKPVGTRDAGAVEHVE